MSLRFQNQIADLIAEVQQMKRTAGNMDPVKKAELAVAVDRMTETCQAVHTALYGKDTAEKVSHVKQSGSKGVSHQMPEVSTTHAAAAHNTPEEGQVEMLREEVSRLGEKLRVAAKEREAAAEVTEKLGKRIRELEGQLLPPKGSTAAEEVGDGDSAQGHDSGS
eukprot:Hpha_TRINITY_DN24908_c0_g1::TRINITY_DN24908_c0_g1_i1::g.111177::m.111177